MKILHVLQSLSRNFGGTQAVVIDLATAQSEAGLDVDVASTNIDSFSSTLPVERNCFIKYNGARYRYCSVQFRPLLFSENLRRFLKGNVCRYDIVHVHGLYRFPQTYAAWKARVQSVPYVITPHGALDPYLYARSTKGSIRVKRLYERWFDLRNLNAAGAIHYTAEEERERASFLNLRASSIVIPNGLDWTRYRELPTRGALRARWGLEDAPLVLFLGRLHFKKGLDLLISAFDALGKRAPGVQLVIAGPENDDYGQKVRGWVRERGLDAVVHFVGSLEGQDVVQAYVDADVFVLPSYTENFGMSVAEAMACELPVVISDQVNIHAEVASAGAGLVTRCDADDVALALESLLNDADRRNAMGAAGRRLVQERYTWPAIVEALTREYEGVIERTKSGKSHSRARPRNYP